MAVEVEAESRDGGAGDTGQQSVQGLGTTPTSARGSSASLTWSGAKHADRAVVQARKFGATFLIPGEARSLDRIDGHFVVTLTDGSEVEAHTVVLATGVRYRRLDVPGMDRLEGPSV
ncbi:hypothetical protein [Marmoricola sp. RAF53]|uniref:hypothetical protein n=1 Tax=Marmoricola sp. RAF53 TaxID=3233059 RepID=UPI003F9A6A88